MPHEQLTLCRSGTKSRIMAMAALLLRLICLKNTIEVPRFAKRTAYSTGELTLFQYKIEQYFRWLKHPTNSKKCVSKEIIFPILMKIHTQFETTKMVQDLAPHQSNHVIHISLVPLQRQKEGIPSAMFLLAASVSNLFRIDPCLLHTKPTFSSCCFVIAASTRDPYKPGCFYLGVPQTIKGILAAPPKATPPRNKGLIKPY